MYHPIICMTYVSFYLCYEWQWHATSYILIKKMTIRTIIQAFIILVNIHYLLCPFFWHWSNRFNNNIIRCQNRKGIPLKKQINLHLQMTKNLKARWFNLTIHVSTPYIFISTCVLLHVHSPVYYFTLCHRSRKSWCQMPVPWGCEGAHLGHLPCLWRKITLRKWRR